ncbi:3-dehydroquinate synthase [bacterium AH-315-E10]|nr:3-dehydroquinate synthase [bacterium AH-315-E10]
MTQYSSEFKLPINYKVHFTHGLFAATNSCLEQAFEPDARKLLIFIDQNVASSWTSLNTDILKWFASHNCVSLADIKVVTGGEAIKNDMTIVDTVASLCSEHGICRHSYIMAIGGGAVLDAIGFAASIIHRGVRLIRVPTTVLSQNDSAVGVKNGINHLGLKNFLGTFTPADSIFADFDFLSTLDMRTRISGFAESFKVGIIKDHDFLLYLIKHADAIANKDRKITEYCIQHTAKLHIDHISQNGDPYEKGSSRPLDFGHWTAHKLENLSQYELLHGEAVAIGIAIDLLYAASLDNISRAEADDICAAMVRCGLPIYHPLLHERFDDIINGLDEFREHLGGELTLAMPSPMGQQEDIHSVDVNIVEANIQILKQYHNDLVNS